MSSSSTPNASRRVCCVCKHDESHCDGGRPCSACVEKGLLKERCIVGCLACRQARLICDGRKPCTNCATSNQQCSDMTDISNISFDPVSTIEEATPSQQPQSAGKAKVACLACRRDSKRCENLRPCSRCLSRNEDCINLGRQQKTVKKRCYSCRSTNKKCENRRPCARCIEEGVECVDLIRKATGPGSRIKKACTYCKRAKVQCDNEWPCKFCVRRGFECDTQPSVDSNEQRLSEKTNIPERSQAPHAAAQPYGESSQRMSFDVSHSRREHRRTTHARGSSSSIANFQPSTSPRFASSSSFMTTGSPTSQTGSTFVTDWSGDRAQAYERPHGDAGGPSSRSMSSSPTPSSPYDDQLSPRTDDSDYDGVAMDEDAI